MDDVYCKVIGKRQGSARFNISGADVMTISCVIPNQNEIDEFNLFAKPIPKLLKRRKKMKILIVKSVYTSKVDVI